MMSDVDRYHYLTVQPQVGGVGLCGAGGNAEEKA